jgi:hypothetical protein
MGLADDLASNLDELYRETVRTNAEDAFSIAIAATVRRVVGSVGPVLQIGSGPVAAAGAPDGAKTEPTSQQASDSSMEVA